MARVDGKYMSTLMIDSFEALQDNRMNLLFLKTSILYLFAVSLSRLFLYFQYLTLILPGFLVVPQAGGGGINPDIYWCLTGPFSPKPFKKWFQIKILVFLIIRNSFPSFYFVSFFHETVPKSATFSEKIFGKKSGQIPPPPGRIRVKFGLTKF